MRFWGIKGKLKIVFILMFIILVVSVLITFSLVTKIKVTKEFDAASKSRVIVNPIMDYLEKNYSLINSDSFAKGIEKISNTNNLTTTIIDLEGKVIFNSKDKIVGTKELFTDIKSITSYKISYDNSTSYINFSAPLIVNNVQVGNAIFNIPSKVVEKENQHKLIVFSFIPLVIGIICIFILIIYITKILSMQLLKPLDELNMAVDSIAHGNLDKKITYNTDSELGRFCNSFELMRDELQYSLQKQMELEKSRKELIACISHDLRTPIASIRAYVEGIQDGIAKDSETLKKYISVIGKKTESLTKLINDLFQHSQDELGEFKMNKEEYYTKALFEKILEPLILEFKESSIKFVIKEPIPNILIKVDAIRIEQVIINLIQNAKKYTSSGGTIKFDVSTKGSYIKVSISDTGLGISQKDLPFIFNRFYRGEKSRSRDYGGAGLGLAICKSIVEAHGGEIYAKSILDKGSTFYFTIPKA